MLECWQNIQTCRHKYVVITVRKEPALRQNSRPADSQTNATERETHTKSSGKAALPPRRVHIKILCIFPLLNALDIYVGISLPHWFGSDWNKAFNSREPRWTSGHGTAGKPDFWLTHGAFTMLLFNVGCSGKKQKITKVTRVGKDSEYEYILSSEMPTFTT